MSENTVREDAHDQYDEDDVLSTTAPSGHETIDSAGGEQDSNETVVQLRKTLADQGRELKDSREMLSRVLEEQRELLTTLKQGQSVPNGRETEAPNYGRHLSVLAEEGATTEDVVKAFNAAITEAIADTEKRVSEQLGAQVNGLRMGRREDRLLDNTDRFFREKGVPELAKRGSDFFKFVTDRVNAGDGFVNGLFTAVESNPEEALPLLWKRYLDHKGIKETKPPTREEHEGSILFDRPSSSATVSRDIQKLVNTTAEKEGRNLSMAEIDALLQKQRKRARG